MVGLSLSHEGRQQERGIIAGYRAAIDPTALGLGTMAMIRLRTSMSTFRPA
ncbi:hypothetical protein X771_31715 [Mesorhizobium sp. LSJC277A00]|nr:hypothetical protein X771_31715 [Mesorhizobium sp. LSJC277A00]